MSSCPLACAVSSCLSCAAPDGAGAVKVQQPALDPPCSFQGPAGGPEPKDPSKMEGDKRPFEGCMENLQV